MLILFFWERKENLTFHLFYVSIENLTLFMESRERNLTKANALEIERVEIQNFDSIKNGYNRT